MKYKRSVLNSPGVAELRRKKNVARKRKLVFFSILFVCLFAGLVAVSYVKKINIDQVSVKGNVVVDTKSIEEIVTKNIDGKYLGLFPKTNALIYPRKKIINEISEKYKRLMQANVAVVDFKTLEINVKEYSGKYLWCGAVTPELNSNGDQKCYFADDSGYIFDEAPYFSGDTYLKLYGFLNNNENPSGSYYFKELFQKLIKFNDSLKEIGLKPIYIWINNQEEIVIGLSRLGISPMPPLIYLKIDSGLEKMIENLHSAISTEPLESNLKNNYSKLLYIDLRYGNKVYYKFQ